MEVAVIDWKSIDSRFVKDELYEYINAPKWVDFSAPDDRVDDEAWFCRPGCNHPKTVEDFFNEKERTPTSNSKLQKSASVSNIPPLGDRNKREAMLKKRGVANQPVALSSKDSKYHKLMEDSENQDPNFLTPLNQKVKVGKKAIKSSVERQESFDGATNARNERTPKLKSTLSAKNLFAGGDFLGKVADFCNELKRLAIRVKDKENSDNLEKQESEDRMDNNFGLLADTEKEMKPLLEVHKEKSEVTEINGSKGKQRKKIKNDDGENHPVSLDVKKIKQQGGDGFQQIRTCPPTPQCFSAGQHPPDAPTRMPFKTKALNQERGILQELKQANKESNWVEREEKKNNHHHRGGGGEVAAKPLDVFWFLKPCTL